MPSGTLYLIPVPLAPSAVDKSITEFEKALVGKLRTYIVENEKTARSWLKEIGISRPQSELNLHTYGKHDDKADSGRYFAELSAGEDVGLMSEAGCPAVADPGSAIVAEAHRRGIRVMPLVGPSSILLALMASGFNGQSFAFYGYLPIDKAARARRLKELENHSERFQQTQIFIETPFRNNQLLEEILRSCSPAARLCVACNLTGEDELVRSMPLSLWKKQKIDLHKKPVIFLLHK
jgi:16S rRNA (cytidine1402-2'-O)-methyltransferase